MQKDLILITAYCPDDRRESALRRLVESLQDFQDDFDIMISSHTPIPVDIQKMVALSLFDKKNEILTDPDLVNQPWFSPGNNGRIMSVFLSDGNTHLAVWRLMINGFVMARHFGYDKVHHIEYDCCIKNVFEFLDNSDKLEEFDSVVYMSRQENVDDILFGSCQSYRVSKLPSLLKDLDESAIKETIRQSLSKSPEAMLLKVLQEGSVLIKDRAKLESNGNSFGTIDSQSAQNMIPWAVPFYDTRTDRICFVVWNNEARPILTHQLIINDSQIINFGTTHSGSWRLADIGSITDVQKILVIENDKVRRIFELETPEQIDLFKRISFLH